MDSRIRGLRVGSLMLFGALLTAPGRHGTSPALAADAPKPAVAAVDAFVRANGLPEATGGAAFVCPMAVRFVGKHDRTYIVFGSRSCHPAIVFFDHRAKQWSEPVKIGQTGVPGDPHGLPALAIDDQGFLHVLYGAHGATELAQRSTAPEETDRWGPPVAASPHATYNNVFFVGDTLYWFHRDHRDRGASGGWGFSTSRSGAMSWSAFDMDCSPFQGGAYRVFYPVVWIGREKPLPKFHLFWLYHGSRVNGQKDIYYWKDIYYAGSDDLGKTWRKADGAVIGQRIEFGQGDPVYQGDTHGWQDQIVIDPAGRPGLAFVTGGPSLADRNAAMFAAWTGGKWRVSKICDVGSRYGCAAVLQRGAGCYRAYVAGEKWNGGEVCEYESLDDGQTWNYTRCITRDSPLPNAFPRAVQNASPELQIVWSSGDKGRSGALHAWGDAGTLPDNPHPATPD